MGKYDPLADYLRRYRGTEVDLSFRDIERILGGFLPKAAKESGWWADGDGEAPQKRAWNSVRFVPRPDLRGERVRFVPVAGSVDG